MLKVLVLIIVAIALDNLIEGAFALVSDGEESVLEKICTSSSRNNECDIKVRFNIYTLYVIVTCSNAIKYMNLILH